MDGSLFVCDQPSSPALAVTDLPRTESATAAATISAQAGAASEPSEPDKKGSFRLAPAHRHSRDPMASGSTSTRACASCCPTAPPANGASACATSTLATSCSSPRTRAPSSAPPTTATSVSASRCVTWARPAWRPRWLSHEYGALGHGVLIRFPIGTPGDVLAWFPYGPRLAAEHASRLPCAMRIR